MTKNEDPKACPFCPTGRIVKSSPFYVHLNRLERCPLNGVSWNEGSENFKAWNTRPTVTPTDGDAERALEWLELILDENDVERGESYKTIKNALQSTRRAFRTEDASDEDIASVEAATYGQSTRKPPDKCDGEPSTYWSTKQDFVHPAPVDTIAVPREVLQGVRDYLNEIIELSVIEWEEYSQTIDNIAAKALARLDAVLEGK